MTAETDLLPLPEPAFRLKWRDGVYYVSEPNIGNTDCYTAEQVRACVSSATEALRAEVEEARGLVTEANNSLYGSQSYFHSLDGGPYNRHHLANGIEDLKRRAREGYAAEARAERLAEAGRRVTAAFRAHGKSDWMDRNSTRDECEAAMLALDAALDQETTNG